MLKNVKAITKSILIRTIGVFMAFFIGGAAVGNGTPAGWFWGGMIGVGTVMTPVIVVLGVILIWKASWTLTDIEKTFRAIVANQAEDNEQIKDALEVVEMEDFNWDDYGTLDEED